MLRTFLYNLAFGIFAIFYLPIFLLKLRQAEEPKVLWRERWGILPESWFKKFLGKKIVWLHAVSVGEVMAIEKFLQEWFGASQEYDLVLTTVTPTGQRIAKKLANSRIHVCYFPFDLTFVVRRFLACFKPVCLLLVETEIWPNLLTEAKRRHVPVGIINARLSEKSFKRYQAFSWVFKPLWEKLDFVLAQNEESADRFRKLGILEESVRDMGNMKFDQADWAQAGGVDVGGLRQAWGVMPEDLVLIAGSTHPGEEEVLINVFSKLRQEFPQLKMIIAPRHIERCGSLVAKTRHFQVQVVLSSERKEKQGFDILILNQLGILRNLYQIADLVFMGGSLVPHGGQNPIEPARFEKAILYGPHVFNFQKIYQQLQHGQGALRVSAPDELSSAAAKLLANASERHEMGRKAYQIINRLRGASKRQAGWILAFLKGRLSQERNDLNGQSQELLSTFGRGSTT
ncbi:MAG TPA: 3-deoxy-D-manno-octulosonic acid transferase [Candidatus Omnitrophota bacterium]|nr:3-deoxy-D-manno-octulosonic acid transferase [Candidatus Omnitrophota bacterium]